MSRSFNTAGPCVQGDHYMLDPLVRLDVPGPFVFTARMRMG